MAEYIEREALISDLEDVIANYKDEHTFSTDFAATIVIDILNNIVKCQPAVDVAPVRHGRWEEADWVEPDCHSFGTIRTPKAALRCSNCKNCFKKELLWKDNYCPNCGAKMDGDG